LPTQIREVRGFHVVYREPGVAQSEEDRSFGKASHGRKRKDEEFWGGTQGEGGKWGEEVRVEKGQAPRGVTYTRR